jgi:integrase
MTRCSAIQPGRCFYSNGGERTFIGARFGCSTARSIATFREWLYRPDRVDNIWTLEHEAAFFKSAPAHLHLPLLLGLWTGQREGDLLRLPWSAYDGKVIRLRPRKTVTKKRPRDVAVTIPVGSPLKAALDKAPKISPVILVNTDKRPWTANGFLSSWRKACAAAGVAGVTFGDLRGTAVTRLALVERARRRSRASPVTHCGMCARYSTSTT